MSRDWIGWVRGGLCWLCASAPIALCLGAPELRAETTDLNLSSTYAQSAWPTGHRDSGNTDYVPLVMSRENRIARRLLEGHPIFWPPIAGPEGHLYVTSGKGPGHSNLHAFDGDGELLWRAPPQQSTRDLDSYAIINAPVVDAGGSVYVGDIDQLWAFHPDGKLKWVSDLKQLDVDHGFMTVVISRQGYVGGISSNGKVIFFEPEGGQLALPVLDLPGGNGPPAEDSPPGDLWKNLMDPAILGFMFNLIQGWEMEVANTPALHPQTGRIYITAAGVEADSGVLYGIDVLDERLEIAFQAPMGGGSGSSPAVSHDGKQVYALDEEGHMVAIDAASGERLWQTPEGGGGSASPSVGPDGTVYTAFQDHLLAFNPDGSLKWKKVYNDLAAAQVPAVGGFWSLLFSQPVAFVNSLFTVGEREGWLNIVCGVHIELMPSRSQRTRVPVPIRSTVVAIDLKSGEPIGDPLVIPETSEGFIVPTLDGNAFVTLSGAITSIFYHMLNPFLPGRFEVPDEPRAGLLLLEPNSHRALARDGLAWLELLVSRAIAALAEGRQESALAALRRTALQIPSSRAVMEKATDRGELDPDVLSGELSRLVEVEEVLIRLRDTLRGGSPSDGERAGLESRLEAVQATLAGMVERLAPAARRDATSEGRRIRNP
jgi:outer membrane protein assembly factor BamB